MPLQHQHQSYRYSLTDSLGSWNMFIDLWHRFENESTSYRPLDHVRFFILFKFIHSPVCKVNQGPMGLSSDPPLLVHCNLDTDTPLWVLVSQVATVVHWSHPEVSPSLSCVCLGFSLEKGLCLCCFHSLLLAGSPSYVTHAQWRQYPLQCHWFSCAANTKNTVEKRVSQRCYLDCLSFKTGFIGFYVQILQVARIHNLTLTPTGENWYSPMVSTSETGGFLL